MSSRTPELLPQDTVFELLSSPRRRFVVGFLRTHPDPVELSEIAIAMAVAETETPAGQVGKKERKRAYVSLHQTHLPRLEDAGVVAYDRRTGLVSLRDGGEELLPYLDLGEPETRRRRSSGYLLVSMLGLGAYLAALSGVFGIDATLVGLVILTVLTIVSAAVWLSGRDGPPGECNNHSGKSDVKISGR